MEDYVSFKLPETDRQLALQLWEEKDKSAFELGRLVSRWVEDQSRQGTPAGVVYQEFSNACKGASARTLRYYAETVSHYSLADWEEYYMLSFDHFAKGAFLERNDFVPNATYALEWAVQFAERDGKGQFATADRMTGEFLPQDEIEKRDLKRQLRAFDFLRRRIAGLQEDKQRMAERLIAELEKIMKYQKPDKKDPTPKELAEAIEEMTRKAGAKRYRQNGGVTLYTLRSTLVAPKDIKIPDFHTMSGIQTPEGALRWGGRYHHPNVYWLKKREMVYALRRKE